MPRVSIRAEAKALRDIASSEMRLHVDRIVGMGLFWAWLQIVFSAEALSPRFFAESLLASQDQIWTLSLAFSVACLAGARLFPRVFESLQESRGLIAFSCGLMAYGTLSFSMSHYGNSQVFAVLTGIVGTGVGGALFFLLWGNHFCLATTPKRMLFDTAAFSFITAGLYFVSALLPTAFAQVFCCLLPLLSGALLVHAIRRTEAKDEQRERPASLTTSPGVHSGTHKRGLFALAFLVGLAYGCMRAFTLTQEAASPSLLGAAVVTGIAVSGVLLLLTMLVFQRDDQLYLVCQISLPLIAAGFLVITQIDTALPLPMVILTMGHSYFYYILWVFFVDLAQHTDASPTVIVSTGLLSFLGSTLLSTLANDALLFADKAPANFINLISIFMIYVMVVVLAGIIGKRRKIENLSSSEQSDSVQRWSSIVAQRHGLTPRETEIFTYLVQGYDRSFIRTTLVISNDTVKSHIRHIYSKLDIHSKQEAQALVEQAEADDSRGM